MSYYTGAIHVTSRKRTEPCVPASMADAELNRCNADATFFFFEWMMQREMDGPNDNKMAYTKHQAQPKDTKRPTITVRSSSWSGVSELCSRQTLQRRPETAPPAEIASRVASLDGSGHNHLFPLLPFLLPTTLRARALVAQLGDRGRCPASRARV